MASKFLKIDRAGHFSVGKALNILSDYSYAVSTDSHFYIRADLILFVTKG